MLVSWEHEFVFEDCRMELKKSDQILHPVRLQILLALGRNALTTQEIADRLPDVPKSSIYRHLKVLLDGGIIQVAATHPVKGIEEKVYTMPAPAHVGPDDLASVSADEHLRYFTTYVTALLQQFAAYLASTPAPDLLADRVGYSETHLYATDEEMDTFLRRLGELAAPLLQNPPGAGRRPRKLAIIMHPLPDADGVETPVLNGKDDAADG
jgi:DNA-binding transcriptional ArsR family regulator